MGGPNEPGIAPLERVLFDAGAVREEAAARASRRAAVLRRLLLVLVCVVSTGATVLATRRTSGTFDELAMMAAGARGFHTGVFDGYPQHPRLPQYLYGLPIHLAQPHYPAAELGSQFKYLYARLFFFESGNDPERLAFLGRLPAALAGLLLVLCVYAYTRRRAGPWAGVLAATLVAFMPDVLAHGGVAYADLPMALAYFLAIWSMDVAIRNPTVFTGAVAGIGSALAFSVKYSALTLLAVGPLLLVLQLASGSLKDRQWRRRFVVAVAAAAIAGYLFLVLVYAGELDLFSFRWGVSWTRRVTIASEGWAGGMPRYLLGRTSEHGWWYFFPAAFLFKTPAALHLLILLALVASLRRTGQTLRQRLGQAAAGSFRAPAVGLVVFAAALATSTFDIGFRYALPALPLIAVLLAGPLARLMSRARAPLRSAVIVLVLWFATSSLAYYPFFLGYMSEYGPRGDRGDKVLVDSSLDWGQGLLELRRWMREKQVPRVYLAYFGSGSPQGYGIRYLPLPSFYRLPAYPLPPEGDREPAPEFVVISATLLHGLYIPGADPFFSHFRRLQPHRVLAHSLLVYRL